MKNLISSLIIAAAVTISSATFAQSAKTTSFTPTVTENPQFIVRALNIGGVDVTVVNPKGSKLTIQVVDAKGNTLATKFIKKEISLSRTRFDLNELPDGLYHIVILDGATKEVKDVILDTTISDTFRTVSLS